MLIPQILQRSLSHKLMALFFVVFFCAVCGLTYFAYTSSRKAMFQEFEIRGRTLAKTIASQARTHYRERDVGELTSLLQSLGEGEDIVAILTYRPSKALWLEFSGIQLTVEDLNFREGEDTWQRDILLTKGYRVSEFGSVVVDSSNPTESGTLLAAPPLGWVRLFLDRHALEQRLGTLIIQTLLTSILITMIGGGAFILLLRRSLHVIVPLTAATKQVAAGDLRTTVPVVSNDELGELAECFNRMTEQLLHTTVSKNYVDNIIRSMTDLLIVLNPDGTIQSVNHAALTLLGYEEHELLAQHASILFPLHDNPLSEATYHEILSHGSIHQIATTYLAKDGRTFPVFVSAAVMRNEEGRTQGIACVAKDMTDLKQAEEQLRLHGAAVEAAANAITITDRMGRVTWVNPAFTEMTGFAPEEIIGQNMRLLRSGKHDQAFYKHLWETILSGNVWRGEVINRKKNGSLYTEEQTITPVHDQNGEISHFIGIKQDVTERKRAEKTLQEAHRKLKALDHSRSRFFADISHELRTPLTVIRGEAEVTLRGKEKPISEYRTTLERIVQLSNQMNKLVGDILFLARSESGALEVELQSASLSGILDEVCQETNILARSRSMSATREGVSHTVIVQGDPERLKQACMILTDNAIKYGRTGGKIVIRLETKNGKAQMIIADDGLGIPEEDLPHVFKRAYRGWRGRPSAVGGAGLGLPIAKWIAEAHNGTISIVSTINRGTTVTLELPLYESQTSPADT
ncbi:MAG: PAS domain S-box protein [Nitrospirota bacterium]